MLEFLRGWIINIVTISIVLILFEIIIPTSKLKKILNLVSGFVLLIAVINPFLTLKNGDFKLSDQLLTDSFYIDKKEIEAGSKVFEEKQIKQISEVYKRKLVARIEEETNKIEGVSGSKVSVEINEDYETEKFGELNKVYIELKKGEKQTDSISVNPVVSVKRVNIKASDKKDTNVEQKPKEIDSETKKLTELVKQNLVKSLEIHEDNIVVTIRND